MTTSFRITNKELVLILKEVLAAMEVKDFNRFEIRAYQNAISAIDNLTSSVYDLWENNRLSEIPGVGAVLEGHLKELFTTGEVKKFDAVKHGLPEGMFSLIGIRGIGARKALKLAMAFKLTARDTAIEKVKEAAMAHKIQVLEGFGEKSEQDILSSISETKMTKNEKKRLLLYQAEEIAQRIYDYMNQLNTEEKVVVEKIQALGSLRRRNPTVGDLDIAVCTEDSEAVIEFFMKFPEIHEVLSKGDKKTSVVLKNDIQVDFRTSPSKAYGAMVQYFTGSKQHNVLLRTYAIDRKMSLSEYGIKENDKIKEFKEESSFYKYIGLDYIPPELRHGKDEILAAQNHTLPKLIELSDIKGDLHTHTNDSDGVNTFEEMIEEALKLGYEYYGISDHAPSVQSRGFDEVIKIVKAKKAKIDKYNKSQTKIKILFGYEVNILADATMALPDEVLKELDYVVGSIHTSFNQDRETLTKRLISALENPYVDIIGHPSGRLINEREACDINWSKVLACARDNNKILEINSQPNRLDLADDLVKDALNMGIKLVINSDAHATDQLYTLTYGIDTARRGWATKESVINTLTFKEVAKIFNL